MADHHGHHGHAHDAAHHAADHAHDAHHGHGSFYRAKQPWMNPLTDPYRGWRYDKLAKRRMFFWGVAWAYGVAAGAWMSYRFLTEYNAWTYPYTHAFHEGKYASQATHDNPFGEGHKSSHDEHH